MDWRLTLYFLEGGGFKLCVAKVRVLGGEGKRREGDTALSYWYLDLTDFTIAKTTLSHFCQIPPPLTNHNPRNLILLSS